MNHTVKDPTEWQLALADWKPGDTITIPKAGGKTALRYRNHHGLITRLADHQRDSTYGAWHPITAHDFITTSNEAAA